MEHKTRYSDSSFYDEVCIVCGGTDAHGDDRLQHPCEGSAKAGAVAAAKRKVERAREAPQDAEAHLQRQIAR